MRGYVPPAASALRRLPQVKRSFSYGIQTLEEICESITAAARAENIALAEISGIGAADSFTVGVYNTVTKEYRSNTLNGAYEIVSLTGTLTSKDGEPYLHLHFSAGDENGRVSGGYLNRAAVSATAEIITG